MWLHCWKGREPLEQSGMLHHTVSHCVTRSGSSDIFGVSLGPVSLSPPDGSAIFRGCFRRPENVSIALPASQLMLNMSVDKCVDFCTEKVRG